MSSARGLAALFAVVLCCLALAHSAQLPPDVPPTLPTRMPPITHRLTVNGTRFATTDAGGGRVFLSGVNQAWNAYGADFGAGQFNASVLENTLQQTHKAGGNIVRQWLHCAASRTPSFGSDGLVTGLDPSFVTELQSYLRVAASQGIYVLLSLFDFYMVNTHAGLYNDSAVRQSYIDNALKPLVLDLLDYPAVIWEVFNEPEGATLEYGWTSERVAAKDMLAATNHYSDAIHAADPRALVTIGAWSWISLGAGWYSDAWLLEAGGHEKGYLDFFQVHYYRWMGHGNLSSLDHPRSSFASAIFPVDRPIIVGECSQNGSDFTIQQLYTRGVELGWDG